MWDSVLKKEEALYDFCCSVSWLYVHKVRSAVNPSCDSGSCSASSKFKRYTYIPLFHFFHVQRSNPPSRIQHAANPQTTAPCFNFLLCRWKASGTNGGSPKCVCLCVHMFFCFLFFFSRALPVAKTFHSLRSSIRQTFMTTLTLDPRAPLLSLIIRRWTVGCFRGGSDEVSLRPVDSFSPAS